MGLTRIDSFRKKIISLKHLGIDSMCFIYQFAQDLTYSPLTNTLFTLLESGKAESVTSTVSVAEIFVRSERLGDKITMYTQERFLTSLPNLEIVPITWDIARLASKLRARYAFLKTPDALQIAASLLSGCNGFITNDEKLKQVKEIKVISFDDYI
ncbi:PIN domain-containing protein [Candidatus Gottesmanbacteria bacterium]|nr:PIN domain-containing protein [Candidatus Gottesmanbacteria bacterium]